MTYKMSEKMYAGYKSLRMTHEDIVNYVNNMLGFVNIDQPKITAVDRKDNTSQTISLTALSVDKMRVIDDVIVY